MERILRINGGIVSGDFVRNIIKVFPYLKSIFEQRKNFDEYYYIKNKIISFDLEDIQKLNEAWVKVEIDSEELTLIQ